MKVCQITSMHDWNDDRIYQRACIGLERKGVEVFLVATKPNDLIDLKDNIKIGWIAERRGIKRRWFSSKEAVNKAIDFKADIYHFHDPDLLPHILKIKRKLPNAKIIYDIHENYQARFKAWNLPAFLGILFRKYEKYVISKIDGFSVVSSSMKSLFNGLETPSLIIRNSTDIQRLSEISLDDIAKAAPLMIYTSGTNSHSRNCAQTVEALKYITTSREYNMVFAGRYQPGIKDELLDIARSSGKESLLRLEDNLPWLENFKRTSSAFCGCVFYEDNENNKVGIPNRLFEYMYCSLPVIASDFPELRNIVKETGCGLLVDSEDPKSIANAFTYLLNNPEEAEKMGEKGKEAITKKFGYHIDLDNTIKFYNKILS